jgi:hypothetical protein
MTATEQILREVFADDAGHAPSAADLAVGARRRVRRRRAWLAASVGVIGSVAAGTLISVTGAHHRGATADLRAARAVPDSQLYSCAFSYSRRTLGGLAFAFDGTVAAVGGPISRGPRLQIAGAAVTFHVHEWFRGGAGDSVRIGMESPDAEDGPPAYQVGTRLLVGGQPLFGKAPLDDPVAWGCGFTRYYDADTAQAWREVFGK